MAGRRAPRRSRSQKRPGDRSEWIGGRLLPPFFIEDREEPYRAELVLWMEEHSGLIVGQEVFAPEDTEGAVARVLLAALERPLAGPTRQPDTIRVADTSLAEEVQAAVGDAIPVAVAPTPELDAVMESMLESMGEPDEDESYLEGGRIAPEAVAALFAAAEHLYRMAPWTVATDDQVLRMDIPALGVEGACVTIIGNLGESLGLLVFPSLASYEAFLEATEEPVRKGGRLDLGSGWLALDFERGADLPASMRREVAAHAWPVVEADAYPCVRRYDRDGTPPPLTERDLKIAAACATSFTAFFAQHRGLFEADAFEPVCESYFDRDDLEVRFTVPYEAFALFDVDEDPSQAPAPPARSERARVGRNAPCRCGSGRKYKKCCLARDEQERSAGRERDTHHDLDGALVLALQRFALEHFADAWHRFERDFFDALAVPELAIPWALYHYRVEGASVLDRYLEERGRGLSRAERTWLEAQRASWLTLWEVTEVEPGRSVTLRDLLTDETRCVQEATASQTLVVRDTLLGRVVDADGVSLLCGMYPRALPPLEAAEVVRRARGRLRRKRAVPVERLRDEGFGRYLIQRWEEAVEDLDEARAVPPELQNTDGDALLATTDHFTIAPGEKPAVEAELAALEGAEPPEPGEDPPVYVFLRPGDAQRESWDTTVIGHARVSDTSLQLETNSRERADALRERVEAACGEWIRHRAREHADPLSSKAAPAEPDLEPVPTSPAEERLILEFKQRHYADWVDHPLPALGGKTPREAARTAGGRGALDALLKDMEHHEQRSPGGAAFDFSQIRRELRIE